MSVLGDAVVLGAGEYAIIVLTVTHGATNVSCTTPSGIVLTGTAVIGTDTDVYTFDKLKSYGNYTCSATFSSGTKTQVVNVDAAEQFNALLLQETYLYLYNAGDQCTSITGGWQEKGYIRNDTSSFQLLSDSIYYKYSGASTTSLGTVNNISFADYSYLKIHFETVTSSGWSSTWGVQAFISDINGTSTTLSYFQTGSVWKTCGSTGDKTDYTLIVDISDITSSAYLYLLRDSWGGVTSEISIDKIWLE